MNKDKVVASLSALSILLLGFYAMGNAFPLWVYGFSDTLVDGTIKEINIIDKNSMELKICYKDLLLKINCFSEETILNPKYKVGDKIDLIYSSSFPKIVYIKRNIPIIDYFLSIIALLFIFSGLYLYIQVVRGKVSLSDVMGLPRSR